MENTQQKRDFLTTSELKDRLKNLSDSDWIRLERAAKAFRWGLSIQADDLLNEIFCRALEGKRNCPVDVPVLVFLIRAMESVVSAHLKKRSHDALEQAVTSDSDEPDNGKVIYDLCPDIDSPDEILIAKQTIEKINDAFRGDETAQMGMMGQIDGLSPQEIQEFASLNPIEYASALRSIRRKLDKLEAEGVFK